jgi:hypothetical protein
MQSDVDEREIPAAREKYPHLALSESGALLPCCHKTVTQPSSWSVIGKLCKGGNLGRTGD